MKLKADEKQQVTSQPFLNKQQTWFMLHDLWKMKEPVTAVYFTVLIV